MLQMEKTLSSVWSGLQPGMGSWDFRKSLLEEISILSLPKLETSGKQILS
jgi:hypothetical protein